MNSNFQKEMQKSRPYTPELIYYCTFPVRIILMIDVSQQKFSV